MSFITVYCTKCGLKNNHRYSSIGTLLQCRNCSASYILQPPLKGKGIGCGNILFLFCAIGGLVIALAIIGAVFNTLSTPSKLAPIANPAKFDAPATAIQPIIIPKKHEAVSKVTPTPPTLPQTQPVFVLSPVVPIISDQVADFEKKLKFDIKQVELTETMLLRVLEKNLEYSSKVNEKNQTSIEVRSLVANQDQGFKYRIAVQHLNDITQDVYNFKKNYLARDAYYTTLRTTVDKDEVEFIALLKKRDIPIIVLPPAQQESSLASTNTNDDLGMFDVSPKSGHSGSSGSQYVHGYTRKDGTYVHPYFRHGR